MSNGKDAGARRRAILERLAQEIDPESVEKADIVARVQVDTTYEITQFAVNRLIEMFRKTEEHYPRFFRLHTTRLPKEEQMAAVYEAAMKPVLASVVISCLKHFGNARGDDARLRSLINNLHEKMLDYLLVKGEDDGGQ